MSRTLVTGGTVVTAAEQIRADVLVEDELIVAVGSALDAGDAERVDAAGCWVLPGLIDNHTHLAMPFGGTTTADDFDTGTRAALAGGTTCIVDFALQTDGSLRRGLEAWQAKARDRAHVDYGFHLAISAVTPQALDEIPHVVAEGVTSLKLFLAYKGALMVRDDELLRVLLRAGDAGALTMVHAENGDAIEVLTARALAAGLVDPLQHARTRPPGLEAEATARAIRIADVAGQPIFVVHVTCAAALAEIRAARARGSRVAAETCVQYLTLCERDLARPGFEGAKYVCSPPLRTVQDQQALWDGLVDGGLQICSTDHAPFNFAGQKELGRGDFSKIPNGLPVIEHRLALLYARGVLAGRLTMSDLVRVGATAPAAAFGLDDVKGSVAPGKHADLVVLDPRGSTSLSAADQHMNVDYSPYEGMTVPGAVRSVLARGELVVHEGEIRSRPGRGRYLARRSPALR